MELWLHPLFTLLPTTIHPRRTNPPNKNPLLLSPWYLCSKGFQALGLFTIMGFLQDFCILFLVKSIIVAVTRVSDIRSRGCLCSNAII
ncbi:hypothetical protein V6N13_082807 [Hibiscus sabdariffa]